MKELVNRTFLKFFIIPFEKYHITISNCTVYTELVDCNIQVFQNDSLTCPRKEYTFDLYFIIIRLFLLSRLAKTASITLMASLSITLYSSKKKKITGELFSEIEHGLLIQIYFNWHIIWLRWWYCLQRRQSPNHWETKNKHSFKIISLLGELRLFHGYRIYLAL
jgi:hypothetical protein